MCIRVRNISQRNIRMTREKIVYCGMRAFFFFKSHKITWIYIEISLSASLLFQFINELAICRERYF